jgi:hypothetical protein
MLSSSSLSEEDAWGDEAREDAEERFSEGVKCRETVGEVLDEAQEDARELETGEDPREFCSCPLGGPSRISVFRRSMTSIRFISVES